MVVNVLLRVCVSMCVFVHVCMRAGDASGVLTVW